MSKRKRRRRRARLPITIVVLLLICLALRLWGFHLVRVEGSSMDPTLQSGDIALVTLFDYRLGEPRRGDIVECRFPDREGVYLKRLIGLPGETVEIRQGRTYVDGAPLSEPYATGPTEDYQIALGPDEYLMLGDNRAESYDSRAEDMGPIRRSDFLGRVRWTLWPLSQARNVSD